ncbi:MAG: PDZ domain-containing protein [Opitutales bacterium]
MTKHTFTTCLLFFICIGTQLAALPWRSDKSFQPEDSLVEIELTKKIHSYQQPWLSHNQTGNKNGLVIGPNQILTTADGLSSNATFRIRKGGESRRYEAQLRSIDFQANIALLDVEDPEFWDQMKPVKFAGEIPQTGNLQIYRWRSGRIEERAAEIVRLYIGSGKLSDLSHLVLLASSEISAAGWAEIVMDGNRLVGLTTSGSKNKQLTILPATFIAAALERGPCNDGPGHGFFDFYWMRASNPALLQSKGLDPNTNEGIVVTRATIFEDHSNTLRDGDVILEIDGFPLDKEGKYIDPQYGRLSLEGLSTRRHAAGESIPMEIWRDQKRLQIDYPLPRADFNHGLIPDRQYDVEPRYRIAGGLLFQPLDGPLMRALSKKNSGAMEYYREMQPDIGRPSLVILSTVLPDDYNLGYENIGPLMLDRINGQPIHTLEDVAHALDNPPNGFHRIEFMHDDTLKHLVLDAASLDAATERVLRQYRIPRAASTEL